MRSIYKTQEGNSKWKYTMYFDNPKLLGDTSIFDGLFFLQELPPVQNLGPVVFCIRSPSFAKPRLKQNASASATDMLIWGSGC